MSQQDFQNIVLLIRQSRQRAVKAVNAELIDLYMNIGAWINDRVEQAGWGQGVVKELAEYIQRNEPELKGFSDKNLWRMKQFHETYRDYPKLSTLLRQISWSHNLDCKDMRKIQQSKNRGNPNSDSKGLNWDFGMKGLLDCKSMREIRIQTNKKYHNGKRKN